MYKKAHLGVMVEWPHTFRPAVYLNKVRFYLRDSEWWWWCTECVSNTVEGFEPVIQPNNPQGSNFSKSADRCKSFHYNAMLKEKHLILKRNSNSTKEIVGKRK